MMRRRPHIPVRAPIYIGCEGASEYNYAVVLRELARDRDLPVHLVIQELGAGAGDPLARVELAVRRIAQLRRTRIPPVARFAFLDEDQAVRDPQRGVRSRNLAEENGISIIWQSPCFEALLLRHLPNRSAHRPPDTQRALRILEQEWPGYRKPMDSIALARRLDIDAVRRAAGVEPCLADLLRRIGLLAE